MRLGVREAKVGNAYSEVVVRVRRSAGPCRGGGDSARRSACVKRRWERPLG